MYKASQRIEEFLVANPSGKLTVAVGFASTGGLAWLQERTRGRPVDLLIGDTRAARFSEGSEEGRRKAIDLLLRDDVQIYTWFANRPVRREAHLKVWKVDGHRRRGRTALLIGSANLTEAGLHYNYEAMCEAVPADIKQISAQLDELFRQAWKANKEGVTVKDRLLQYIRASGDQSEELEARSGCFSAVFQLLGVVGCIVLVAYLERLIKSMRTSID